MCAKKASLLGVNDTLISWSSLQHSRTRLLLSRISFLISSPSSRDSTRQSIAVNTSIKSGYVHSVAAFYLSWSLTCSPSITPAGLLASTTRFNWRSKDSINLGLSSSSSRCIVKLNAILTPWRTFCFKLTVFVSTHNKVLKMKVRESGSS